MKVVYFKILALFQMMNGEQHQKAVFDVLLFPCRKMATSDDLSSDLRIRSLTER